MVVQASIYKDFSARPHHAAWGEIKWPKEELAAMKRAAALLVDDGTRPKQPKEALQGCLDVYKQAASSEISCGVPQVSQNAVIREMRIKMPDVQKIYDEFVSTTTQDCRYDTCDDFATLLATRSSSFRLSHNVHDV